MSIHERQREGETKADMIVRLVDEALSPSGREGLAIRVVKSRPGLTKVTVRRILIERPDGGTAAPEK